MSSMVNLFRTVLLLITGFLCCPAWGADAVSTLTADDVTKCIYEYWSSRLRGDATIARHVTETARREFYPSLTATASSGRELVQPAPEGLNTIASITLSQQILNVSQKLDIASKSQNEKAAQFDFEAAALLLMKSAISVYYNYLLLKAQEDLLTKRTDRLEKVVVLTKELNRLHITDVSTVYLAKSEKAQLDISLLKVRNQKENTLNQLKASLGLASQARLELSETEESNVNLDPGFWQKKIEDFPVLQGLRARLEAAQLEGRSARLKFVPTFTIDASYGQLGLYAETEGKILGTLDEISTNQKVSELLKDNLDLSKKAYEAIWTLFSVGKSSFVMVKDAESSLIDTEIQFQSIKNRFQELRVSLELLRRYTNGRLQSSRTLRTCPVQP
jgi:outer membrane protein TolC